MSFFERLQRETAAERAHLLSAPIIHDAMAGRVTLDQYRAFLTQAFHHVRHTVPLLMSCGGRLPAHHEPLRHAIEGSGLFYESHLADWVAGKRPDSGCNRRRSGPPCRGHRQAGSGHRRPWQGRSVRRRRARAARNR